MKLSAKINRKSSVYTRLRQAARLRWVINGVVFVFNGADYICEKPSYEDLEKLKNLPSVELFGGQIAPTIDSAKKIEEAMKLGPVSVVSPKIVEEIIHSTPVESLPTPAPRRGRPKKKV